MLAPLGLATARPATCPRRAVLEARQPPGLVRWPRSPISPRARARSAWKPCRAARRIACSSSQDRAAADILRANVEKLGASPLAEIRVQPAEHALPPSPPADLILADPPYASPLAQLLLDRIGQGGWLAPGGWLSVETAAGKSLAVPPSLRPMADRRFGKAHLTLFTCAPTVPDNAVLSRAR